MKLSIYLLISQALLITGCTNYLYMGSLEAEDSSGDLRETVLYWTKTDPLLGAPKADSAVLRTACGIPVTFTEQENGIFFVGNAENDRRKDDIQPVKNGEICGQLLDAQHLTEIGEGVVNLRMDCEPNVGEFSVARNYLAARAEPYAFDIQEYKRWSFLGNPYEAPVPECPQQSAP